MPAGEVILLGSSLGAGIATDLATRLDHRLLILQAPFTSFPDIAQTRVPFFPVRWLARNKFDNVGKVAKVKAPVFVVHGDADEVIAYEFGQELYNAARPPKTFWTVAGATHNDLHLAGAPEFQRRLEAFYVSLSQGVVKHSE